MQINNFSLIAPMIEALTSLAAQLQQSTVQVRGRRGEAGSGVIWNENGLIISNAHVVRGASATVELSDGRTFSATVQRRDHSRDLVALQINANHLPAAKIGDARSLRVGELVIAVGNPLGIVGAVTTGMIYAAPSVKSPLSYVQADVHLAPGNSGGLLANVNSEVIGINSMIVNGLAIAIPSHVVEQFLQPSTTKQRKVA